MKLLLTFFLLGATILTSAQTIEKTVIASGGEPLSNNEINLNLTLGEPLIGPIVNDYTIAQGFWAVGLTVEPMIPEEELGGIVIYPNPVEDQLNIFTNSQRVFGISMFAVDGKLIFQKKVEESRTEHLLDASILAKGVYVLRVFVEGDSEEKIFKIIKR